MRCAGFVMTDEAGSVLGVSVGSGASLLKSHVKGYTRKDGTFVKEHDDSRQAAAPQASSPAKSGAQGGDYDHPNVVGKPSKLIASSWSKETGHVEHEHTGKPTDASEIEFNGRRYLGSGKTGESSHDGTPVRRFVIPDGTDEGSDPIWLDDKNRVHADARSDVAKLRQEHEAHRSKSQSTPERGAQGKLKAGGDAKSASPKKQTRLDAAEQSGSGAGAMPAHIHAAIKSIAESSAAPEHKKAAIDALTQMHANPAAVEQGAPKEGDVGHEELQQYGVYHRKGDKVKDNYGKTHTVASHVGPVVRMTSGETFHPTKVHKQGGKPMAKSLLFTTPDRSAQVAALLQPRRS